MSVTFSNFAGKENALLNHQEHGKRIFLQNFSLEGKVALVYRSILRNRFGIATAFAQCGATIVFNDIKQKLVDKGLAAYKEKGIKAHGCVCDVTDKLPSMPWLPVSKKKSA